MWKRHAITLVGLLLVWAPAQAEEFRIEDAGTPPPQWDVATLKPATIMFSDGAPNASGVANLVTFTDWGRTLPVQKKFLSLYPSYTEPTVTKSASADVPPFATIAKSATFNARQLAYFLLEPHPKMPNLSLSRSEADDLAAYIESLRK